MFVDHAVTEERLPSSNKVGDARWEIGEKKGTRFWRESSQRNGLKNHPISIV